MQEYKTTKMGSHKNGNVWVKKEDSPESSESGFLDADQEDPTNSQQALLRGARNMNENADVVDSGSSASTEPRAIASIPKWRRYAGVGILFYVNLLNYMDRFTIAGVLMDITRNFQINNAMAGLLQTVFIISYMLVAPLFGYLGDRYNRKIIMVVGIFIWSGCTLASSFIQDPEHFPLFLMTRALVGIGEASYATIAPTLIGDMFIGSKRTQMLSVFFFATPIGSGLGYIVGSGVAKAFGGWEWALRVTPGLGIIAIILLILFCPNPPRGASETTRIETKNQHTYIDDLRYLSKNKSFIYVSLGFTFMAFVIGSLTLWGPTFFAYSQIAIGLLEPCQEDSCDYTGINFVFGLITCIAGFAGVGIGAESARRWKARGCEYADALVCAIGLFLGSPLLFIGVHIPQLSIDASWVMIFLADMCLCFTWTLISDMTLYVTEPSRRSTANAVQLLIGHLLGDAGSPYLIGVIADAIIAGKPDTYMNKFIAYQRSMYITLFLCIVGAAGFLMASLYVVEDKKKVEKFLSQSDASNSTKTTSSGSSSTSVELETRTRKTEKSLASIPSASNGPVFQINGDVPDGVTNRSSYDIDDEQYQHLLGHGSQV